VRFALGTEFDVATANSGPEALEMLVDDDYAVVVCDQRMPGMTGVEVCARARELAPHTHRVIITAFADSHAVVDAINEGAVSGYLTKPFREDQLAQVLREAIVAYREAMDLRSVGSTMLGEGLNLAARTAEAEIAHDINNLLTPASLVLQAAQSDLEELRRGPGPVSPEALSDLAGGLDELAASLAVLQSFVAAIREGERKLGRGVANIGRVIDATARMFEPRVFPTAELSVEVLGDAVIALEPSGLTQVFVNLLVNALESLERQGSRGNIAVRVRVGESAAELQVHDDGEGIAAEDLERIFESGYTTRENGTGRGLAISRRIVEAAGGSIQAKSDAGGTLFVVSLPILGSSPSTPS
ncbi:MAG: hybrid sensor histidine kinase/response regulator, partial [Myxococcota bacterium]